ncbi:MAG: helix-turn-helix domain-containing protein [Propionibacterium sp.]|nr:helix-turn-helix domain-containing protein [Propionibacterium sp.]
MPAINQSVQDLKPISVPDMADILGKSTRTVERLLDSGALKTVEPRRKGRVVRITAASARAYLDGEMASCLDGEQAS